ncbi:protein 2 3 complex subunit [Cladochytrium tenue]|nr:protein 2 3 complex subunit [Cladochytrium tenue]
MSNEATQLIWGTPITCHAFNKDRSMVAICPNSRDVHIYKKSGSSWAVTHVLSEVDPAVAANAFYPTAIHTLLVTSIDWAPETNKIVTCGQDRDAYVWSFDGQTWKPQLVLLRINRAATFVRWSPQENKFAVGTGSKLTAIGHFGAENDWYLTDHIKKHFRSTVVSLAWHPDNITVAAGCADMKVRVLSAYVKSVDPKPSGSAWGEKTTFGHLHAEFGTPTGGWVHSVAFSPSGNVLAWTGHDGNVSLAYGPSSPVITVVTNHLPLLSLVFTSENTIVAGGHDCVPYLFAERGGNWALVDKIDKGVAKAEFGNSAMNTFKQMDKRAQAASTDTELNSVHQNTITSIRAYETVGGQVRKISSTGVDGKLVIWKL